MQSEENKLHPCLYHKISRKKLLHSLLGQYDIRRG